MKYEGYLNLLRNENFLLQLDFLNHIVGYFNTTNSNLQDNLTSEISKAYTHFKILFNNIFVLVCKPDLYDREFLIFTSKNWEEELIQSEWWLESNKIIHQFKAYLSKKYINVDEALWKDEFVDISCRFIGKTLNCFIEYLPFNDKVIQFA